MKFAFATIIAALSLGTTVFATPILSSSSSLATRNDPVSCITTVTSDVATLNVDVNANLQVTVSAVSTNPSILIVPFVQIHIAEIIASFNAALVTIIPVAFAAPIVLAEAEVALLLDSAKIFSALILNIKSQFDYILVTVHQDALLFIKAQLKAAISIASVLGTAYVDSVSDIVNAIINLDSQLLSEVKDTVQDIQHIIDELLSVLH